MSSTQRLGKNHGGYFGERIDAGAVVRGDLEHARQHGWSIDELPASPELTLFALRRPVATARRRIYISTGIHGDEPAGPLAISRLLQDDRWPEDADLWVCPCLNPTGFARNTRANADGIDLNRDYREPRSAEIRAHVAWLQRQPRFDLSICVHEDWEAGGFYVYELKRDERPTIATHIVQAVADVCPIDQSPTIDERPSSNGVIRPVIDPDKRPDWPEALFLFQHHSPHNCTLEAPSDFPLALRVHALVLAVRRAIELV